VAIVISPSPSHRDVASIRSRVNACAPADTDVGPAVAIIAHRPGTTATSSQGCSAVQNSDTSERMLSADS